MNSRAHIMVVEDSDDIRELIGRLYGSEGYNVTLARDGRDALEKLRETSELPSVILLDIMMPGMDGMQFCLEQKKDPKLASIPVIVMTADANPKEKAQIVGAKGYIRKPTEVDTLLKIAEKYCK